MTILVTGGRGAVAGNLVPLLRQRGLPVRVGSSAPEGADTVRCDLTDPNTFPAALDGIASVFLYAEPSHIDAFVTEAVSAGVRHIVLLSSAAVFFDRADDSPLAKSHLDVERALIGSPIQATLLRPGTFAGNALAWAWTVKSGEPISLPFPGAHCDPIHEADMAGCAAAVLADPTLGGRPYTLTGPQSLTFAEQIDVLGRAIGREIGIKPVSRQEWKAAMADHVRGDFADALLDWWQSCDGVPATLTATVEELTGRPARTFDAWAREHAGKFTH
ncbi:SDR family oxidoreductase [Streptosporangium sp. CA-135522]|uniref:SDR family oxidoreductase n=1 Tax=Streptosporangium sp. CA-135522 TaxID=3240072 RepID=UPI003D90AD80